MTLVIDERLYDDLRTVRDWIRWGATQMQLEEVYFGHGTDNAWDDAAQIVLWVVRTPWQKLEHIIDCRLTQDERRQAAAAFARRVNERMPVPYITGVSYFCGLEFEVTQDTLIPRSPIAELIHNQFAPWINEPPTSILDLCTGSGCIGIACAMAFPDAVVILSDISSQALEVARGNVHKHGLQDQVSVVEADLFDGLDGPFDLIVSNPPYVDAQDMASLPSEYRLEPQLALASGNDGLDFTRRFLAEARQFLTSKGVLIVEVGNSAEALERAFPEVPFMWLEFEHGGQGVFLLTYDQLTEYQDVFHAGLSLVGH